MKQYIHNNKDLSDYVTKICLIDLKGKDWVGSFNPVKKKRSLRANNLYWMWIACICDDLGYDKRNKLETQAVHDGLRELLLPYKWQTILGSECRILTSTTTLDTKQFAAYMNSIKMHMITEYAIDLPLPEDRRYNEFCDLYRDYSK